MQDFKLTGVCFTNVKIFNVLSLILDGYIYMFGSHLNANRKELRKLRLTNFLICFDLSM